MKKKERSPFLSKLVNLVRDEKGQILLMFTIMILVIMGVLGLSLEVGRVWHLRSQLQDLADAAALAGARKLDGSPGAIANAKIAAEAVNNQTWWSDTPITTRLATTGFKFYSQLNPDALTDLDENAFYIKVTTSPGGIVPAFLTAVGAVNTRQTTCDGNGGLPPDRLPCAALDDVQSA